MRWCARPFWTTENGNDRKDVRKGTASAPTQGGGFAYAAAPCFCAERD